MNVSVGNAVEMRSTQVGQPARRGTVTEIISLDPPELRVDWGDGHESVLFPSGGMLRVLEDGST